MIVTDTTRRFLALALAPLAAHAAPSAAISEKPAVIPLPAKLDIAGTSGFSLANGLPVATAEKNLFPDAVRAALREFPIAGVKATDNGCADCADALTFRKVADLPAEGYRIVVTPDAVVVEAGDASGAFYAVQTLVQSVVKDAAGKPALPAMSVNDRPRFPWRGIMVDVGRHFVPAEEMKRMLDLMALYKFNILHWHLTEDQGWRIEIKKYPKLTEIGSVRTMPSARGTKQGDVTRYGPFFYTREQVKDIVAYAKARAIVVVPEIEMPGHCAAAIASYPELGNSDIPDYAPKVRTSWGIEPYVYAPKEETFKFLDDVIGEVASMFPDSPYIHIGGDECPKEQWNRSPFAQALMKKEGLLDKAGKPDAHRLQSWFIARVEKMVNAHGKKLIGWDEIRQGGLSPTATMMIWHGGGNIVAETAGGGNDLVLTPKNVCYLSKPGIPISTIYSFEPVPDGLPEGAAKHVLGVQANLWSERISDRDRREYLTFPRAIALAEVGWSPKSAKDFNAFSARLAKNETLLDELKANYRKNDGSPAHPGGK